MVLCSHKLFNSRCILSQFIYVKDTKIDAFCLSNWLIWNLKTVIMLGTSCDIDRYITNNCLIMVDTLRIITVTHLRHGIATHRQTDCLLKIWFLLTTTQTSKIYVTDLREGSPSMDSLHKGTVIRIERPYHCVIMTNECNTEPCFNSIFNALKSSGRFHYSSG